MTKLANELEVIRTYIKDLTSDTIVDHNRIGIYEKMQRLSDERVKFQKTIY